MTQINIEPRPRRSALPYVLGLLLVAVIALAVWFFLVRDGATAEPFDSVAPPPAATDTSSGI